MSRIHFRGRRSSFSMRFNSSSNSCTLAEVVACIRGLGDCFPDSSFRLDIGSEEGDLTYMVVPRDIDFCVYTIENNINTASLKEKATVMYPELLRDWNSGTLKKLDEESSGRHHFFLLENSSQHHPCEETALENKNPSDESPVEVVSGSSDSKTSRADGAIKNPISLISDTQIPFQDKHENVLPDSEELTDVPVFPLQSDKPNSFAVGVSKYEIQASPLHDRTLKFINGSPVRRKRRASESDAIPPSSFSPTSDKSNPLPLSQAQPQQKNDFTLALDGEKSEYMIPKSINLIISIGDDDKKTISSIPDCNGTSLHSLNERVAALSVCGDSISQMVADDGQPEINQHTLAESDQESGSSASRINNGQGSRNNMLPLGTSNSIEDSLSTSSIFHKAIECEDINRYQVKHNIELENNVHGYQNDQVSRESLSPDDNLLGRSNELSSITAEQEELLMLSPFAPPVEVDETLRDGTGICMENIVIRTNRNKSDPNNLTDTESPEFSHFKKYENVSPGTVIYVNPKNLISLLKGGCYRVPNLCDRNLLGSGGNGWVYKDQTFGQNCAIKMTKYRCRELNTWVKLDHPNLIHLMAVMMGPLDTHLPYRWCYQFMPLMSGSLKDKLYPYKNLLEWAKSGLSLQLICDNVLNILENVLKALRYLKSKKMQHQDVKESNILILQHCCTQVWSCTCPRGQKYAVKLADVDSLKEHLETTDHTVLPIVSCEIKNRTEFESQAGTIGYRSPEQLVNPLEKLECFKRSVVGDFRERQETTLCGPWSDIWSLGRTIVVLFLGREACNNMIHEANVLIKEPNAAKHQFTSKNEDVAATVALKELLSISTEQQSSNFSLVVNLANKCMTADFRDRKTAHQLLELLSER